MSFLRHSSVATECLLLEVVRLDQPASILSLPSCFCLSNDVGRLRSCDREISAIVAVLTIFQEGVYGCTQDEVKDWFQQALGVRCCLVRQQPGSRKPIAPLQAPWPGKGCGADPTGHIGKLSSEC